MSDLVSGDSGPAPYGLLSVVETPTPGDRHWVNGVEFEHSACMAATGYAAGCDDEVANVDGLPRVNDVSAYATGVADAFQLYATHTCSPLPDDQSQAKANGYALDALINHEQEAIEAVISSGDLATTPSFTDATVISTGANPISFREGFGYLSDFAASTYGTRSVLHIPRYGAGYLGDLGVSRVDGHLEAITGEWLSLGAGYVNASPTGTPASLNEAWMCVTPPPVILATEPTFYTTPDTIRDTNDVIVHAEKTYVVAWKNCPIAAVLISGPSLINNPT